jgi:hypothetical protein
MANEGIDLSLEVGNGLSVVLRSLTGVLLAGSGNILDGVTKAIVESPPLDNVDWLGGEGGVVTTCGGIP